MMRAWVERLLDPSPHHFPSPILELSLQKRRADPAMTTDNSKMGNGNASIYLTDQLPFPLLASYFLGSSAFFGSSAFLGSSALMPSQPSITSLLFSFTMYSEIIFCSIFV